MDDKLKFKTCACEGCSKKENLFANKTWLCIWIILLVMCHLTILYNSIAMQSFFKEIFVSPSYSNIHKQPAHKLKTINFTYVQCRLVYKQSIHVHWYLKQLLIKWVNIISPYHIYTKLPPFKNSLPFKYAK